MDLLVLDNDAEKAGFFAAVSQKGWRSDDVVWIGGGNDGECMQYHGGSSPAVYPGDCSIRTFVYCEFTESNPPMSPAPLPTPM